MHPQNYDIAHFETVQAAKLAGYMTMPEVKANTHTNMSVKQLTDTLMGMNRKERRAWMAQQRKKK